MSPLAWPSALDLQAFVPFGSFIPKHCVLCPQQAVLLVICLYFLQICSMFNKVKENREILKRLIDAVIFLCCQELPLRKHNKTDQPDKTGNCKELINLLSK
jgi:hypothetical protein